MTSIDVAEATAAALRTQAARSGMSVDAYVRRLAVFDSVRLHNEILVEEYYEAAESERAAE